MNTTKHLRQRVGPTMINLNETNGTALPGQPQAPNPADTFFYF